MTDRKLTDKAVKFKGSDYVMVKDRIQFLADNYDGKYSINTEYEYFPEQKMRVVKAELTIGNCTYTWLAQEIDWVGFVNKTSALENAETSAVGRACAMAWIGVIDSIASMDEIAKATNRAKSDEMVKDTPFTKPTFGEKEFLKFKEQSNRFSFDEAWKIIHEKYSVSTDMEHKVMDVYWVDWWALFE